MKQQTLAMQLFTRFKKDKYLMWSATSLLLLVQRGERERKQYPTAADELKKAMSLLLMAEKFVLRQFSADKPMLHEDVWLAARVLLAQNKRKDAIDLLMSKQARPCVFGASVSTDRSPRRCVSQRRSRE